MAGNEQVVEFHSPWAEHQTLSIYSVSLGWFWPHKIWLFKHVAPPSTYQNDPERAQTGPKISHHQGTLTQAPSRVEMVEPESHSMEMVEFSSYKKPMISHGMGMVWAPSWSRTMVQSPVFETNPDVPNISSKKYLVFRVLKVDNDILILPIHGGIKFGIHSIPPICCMLKVMKKDYRKLVFRPLRWLS